LLLKKKKQLLNRANDIVFSYLSNYNQYGSWIQVRAVITTCTLPIIFNDLLTIANYLFSK